MKRLESLVMCACVLGAVTVAGAVAAPTPWSNPNGSTPDYSWSNGQNAEGRFGSPNAVPGRFDFFPAGLEATSNGRDQVSVGDTLSFELLANGSKRFGSVKVNLTGDYAILGDGASVSTVGILRVTNLATSAVLTQGLVANPSFPVAAGAGIWSAMAELSLPANWKNVLVEVENTNSAVSSSDSTGLIATKVGQVGVTVVPLPAAVLAAPAGFAVMFWARRRMTRR